MYSFLTLFSVLVATTGGNDVADYSGSGPKFVVENDPIFVTCRVVNFSRIKWHLNGRPITARSAADAAVSRHQFVVTTEPRDGYLVSNLTVPAAQHEHSGNYRCTSFVDNEYSVHVLSADMIKTNADASDGLIVLTGHDDLVLECNATQITVEAVDWFKSVEAGPREAVAASDRIVIDAGRLVIKHPTEDDTGNYTCAFTTTINDGRVVEETLQVVTNVTVRMPGKSSNVQEGEDLHINCRVFGKPTPIITWTKDERDINTLANASIRLSFEPNDDGVANGALNLKELIRPDDRGDFCCHAANVANAAQACILVRVKDKYAALWPFIGIVVEVIVLTAIIYIYEKRKSKPDVEDSDTDHGNNDRPVSKGDVRQRK